MNRLNKLLAVLSRPRYLFLFLAATLAFLVLFFFLLGLNDLPWTDPAVLETSVTWTVFLPHAVLLFASAVLNGMILACAYCRFNELSAHFHKTHAAIPAASTAIALLMGACPACVVSLGSAVGLSVAASVFLAYFTALQLVAVVIAGASLYRILGTLDTPCADCDCVSKQA